MKIDEPSTIEFAIRSGFTIDLFIQKEIFDSIKNIYRPCGNTEDGKKRTNKYLDWKKSRTTDGGYDV
jgi:hypothetical protein